MEAKAKLLWVGKHYDSLTKTTILRTREYWLADGEFEDPHAVVRALKEDESIGSVDYVGDTKRFTIQLKERYGWETTHPYVALILKRHLKWFGVTKYSEGRGWFRDNWIVFLVVFVIFLIVVAVVLNLTVFHHP